MLSRILSVVKPVAPKIRLGSKYDGGYVIVDDIGNYDAFFSAGVSNDVNFENDFITKIGYDIPCLAYDGTVHKLPPGSNPKIQFFSKNIAATNSAATTNLLHEIEPFNDVFLKMDIESHEYAFFLNMPAASRQKLKQIVVEVHQPFTYGTPYPSLDLGWTTSQKFEMLLNLAATHHLVHLHGNNYSGTTFVDGIEAPNVLELTYVRKGDVIITGPSTDPIPGPHDAACCPYTPEIVLNHKPFYYNS